MTEVTRRGSPNSSPEFDSSPLTLRARWAAELGETIYYAFVDSSAITHRNHGVLIVPEDDDTVWLYSNRQGLQSTRKAGSFISRVVISSRYKMGALNRVSVQFFRAGKTSQAPETTTTCESDNPAFFAAQLSRLSHEEQGDVIKTLLTLGENMLIDPERLEPSDHLRRLQAARNAALSTIDDLPESLE